MQRERDCLLAEVENLAANSDGQTQKLEDTHSQKLKALESQVDSPIFLLFIYLSNNIYFLFGDLNLNIF
jgi:hypothetical protein